MRVFKSLSIICFLYVLACSRQVVAPSSDEQKGDPIAKIDDAIIYSSDLNEKIETIEKETPQVLSTHPQKRRLLDQVINIELLYQEALRLDFDKSYHFKAKLADAFVSELGRQGIESVTPESLKRYYEENKINFDEVSARHILLKMDRRATSAEKKIIYNKIKELREDLVKNPDQFPDYAKKYSEDPGSGARGGELGFFKFPQMVPEFSKAAFGIEQINSISAIIQTQFGYHIIQLTGDRRGVKFHEPEIRQTLVELRQKEKLSEMLEKLKKNANIEIYSENLQKMSPLPKEVLTDPEELLPKNLNEKLKSLDNK